MLVACATCVCVLCAGGEAAQEPHVHTFSSTTTVEFDDLSDEAIEAYIASGGWVDEAIEAYIASGGWVDDGGVTGA